MTLIKCQGPLSYNIDANLHFVFGCTLAELLLKQLDNLRRTLLDHSMSAVERICQAQEVAKTMAKDRIIAPLISCGCVYLRGKIT